MAGYLGFLLTPNGFRIERGLDVWRITRPGLRWGVNVGITWGPWRNPRARPGRSAWFDRPLFVVRSTGRFLSRWVSVPWFHAWRWPEESAFLPILRRVEEWHPARFYIGGKLFHVGPDGVPDPAGHAWAKPSERGEWFVTITTSFRRGGKGR